MYTLSKSIKILPVARIHQQYRNKAISLIHSWSAPEPKSQTTNMLHLYCVNPRVVVSKLEGLWNFLKEVENEL